MSKGKRYTHEFKVEAVKQITERGYSAADVDERLLKLIREFYIASGATYGSPWSIVTYWKPENHVAFIV